MTWQVDTVFLWVTDLDRSLDWYAALGIDAGASYGDWQVMSTSGETTFALHRGQRPAGPPTGGIAFRVEDLGAEIERLETVGVTAVDAEVTDTGSARFITYVDPDGNHVQLLER